VVVLRLFAAAREAAGAGRVELTGTTVDDVLRAAEHRFGPVFAAVVSGAQVWRNGEPCTADDRVDPEDEVAVLPPVSGGAS
jgi:sulfur-carrier protein